MHKFILSAMLCWLAASSHAQTAPPKTDSPAVSKSHLYVGLTYNSALNYYGRTDSLKSMAICPYIGLSLKNGLFLNTTAVFILNKLQSQYAATLIEGGYSFTSKKANWSGSASITKFFYRQGTDLLQSVIKESSSISISHLSAALDITMGADIKHSDKFDFGAQTGIDHIFHILHPFKNTVLLIAPSVNVYAGTQNFSRTWYQQKSFLFLPTSSEQFTEVSRRFDVLAYECSIPIVLARKNMTLALNPSYIIPHYSIPTPALFCITSTFKYSL